MRQKKKPRASKAQWRAMRRKLLRLMREGGRPFKQQLAIAYREAGIDRRPRRKRAK